MSFNSKYSGQQVENLLDQVANGNTGGSGGGGGITTELDPIFSASPAAKITDENITSWNNKVDKVDGKQLSTEDFTTLLKQKLDGLFNYDDTEIQNAVTKLRTDLNTLVSGDTTTAIKTFNEVIAFLDGISDTEDLSGIIASIEQQIAAKQEKLVSGTNIKTINGTSILGSGNIVVEGGSGGSSSGSGAYAEVNHGTSDTTFILTPNTLHVWDEVASLDLTLGAAKEGIVNEYVFQFKSGIDGTSLTLPEGLKWVEGASPNLLANRYYEISIVNNLVLLANINPYIVNEIVVECDDWGNILWNATYPLARKLYVHLENGWIGELNAGEIEGSLIIDSPAATYSLYLSFTDNPEPYVHEINDGTYLYKITETINIPSYN